MNENRIWQGPGFGGFFFLTILGLFFYPKEMLYVISSFFYMLGGFIALFFAIIFSAFR